MQIILYISDDCKSCRKEKDQLLEEFSDDQNINLDILSVSKTNIHGVIIVPALFVNNKLFSYGEINFDKLKQHITFIRTNVDC